MKKIGILITALVLACGLSANNFSADKQYSKESRSKHKEQKNADVEKQYKATANMLDSMSFVLEANTLRNQIGNMLQVSSTLNFIMVDSAQAVIQVGNNTRIGANGVGGVTAKGRISDWKLIKNDKRKTFTLSMSVMTPIGFYDVIMYVSADGNATAILSGLGPGKLTYDGQLKPLAESRVYEGRSL
jgi:hypothetical protein